MVLYKLKVYSKIYWITNILNFKLLYKVVKPVSNNVTNTNFFLVCDQKPVVINSQSNEYILTEKREEDYLHPTTLVYSCLENYILNYPETVCSQEGIWEPQVYCYPGMVLCLCAVVFYL